MQNPRERGTVLVFVVLFAMTLMGLTAASVMLSRNQALAYTTSEVDTSARSIVESALALAVSEIRDGGIIEPKSGSGANPSWVEFADGEYYYESELSEDGSVNNVVAWARVAVDPSPSSSSAAPDEESWDGDGWFVRGLEVAISNNRYVPNSPLYFGEGGIQKPQGGFTFSGSADLQDPDSWDTVTSGPHSYQSSSVPFNVSALDHPADYLTSGDAPAAPITPHPYPIIESANPIAQFNAEAWFNNSAGSGDATDGVAPGVNLGYYDTIDKTNDNYVFPVDSTLPKVQSLAWSLWNDFKDDPDANLLDGGTLDGTYGTLANPEVTFVTGKFEVASGTTFKGAGVLVIRDDYDPNVDSDNTPSDKALMKIAGTLEWTGLVIVAGWNPSITSMSGSSTTIVGALLGEDSVQSFGEPSLNTSAIWMRYSGDFNVLYSRSMFEEDGELYDMMPEVDRTIVAIKSRTAID